MKKILFFCCLLLWSCQNGPTESEPGAWQVVRESSGDIYYSALHFADQNHGWAVGNSGTIIHTTDGGNTWEYQESGTGHDLRDIHFIDSRIGWVVGDSATILRTTDGGQSWQPLTISGDSTRIFTSIHFTDEMTGWLVHNHGEILGTKDGGATWEVQASWERGGTALLSIVSNNVGYAIPLVDSLSLKTTDGGAHWLPISNQRFRWETDLFFIDEQHGWVSNSKAPSSLWEDYANVYRTSDGGATWTCIDTLNEKHLTSIYFVDEQLGWTAGRHKIFNTTDGGQTWVQQVYEEEIFFERIYFTDAEHGWVLSWRGSIYKYAVH